MFLTAFIETACVLQYFGLAAFSLFLHSLSRLILQIPGMVNVICKSDVAFFDVCCSKGFIKRQS